MAPLLLLTPAAWALSGGDWRWTEDDTRGLLRALALLGLPLIAGLLGGVVGVVRGDRDHLLAATVKMAAVFAAIGNVVLSMLFTLADGAWSSILLRTIKSAMIGAIEGAIVGLVIGGLACLVRPRHAPESAGPAQD